MPIQRVPLADQAVSALLQVIEDRGLKENDTLPSTAELAEALDVSRTVVREAIAELAGQGLLSRRQGRETQVTLPSAKQLERLLHLRFVVLGHDYSDLQEFREVIEIGAARLAASRATAADVDRLRELLNQMREATSEEERHQADQAFHRAIATASGNDMVLLTLDGITPLLFQLRLRAWSGWSRAGGSLEALIDAHAAVIERIAAQDSEGAAAAMIAHLSQAREGLLNSP